MDLAKNIDVTLVMNVVRYVCHRCWVVSEVMPLAPLGQPHTPLLDWDYAVAHSMMAITN